MFRKETPQETVIYVASSTEELAKKFASVIRENCLLNLEFWRATSIDDPQEYIMWEQKMETVPAMAEQKAFERISDIIKNPNGNMKYYKKIRRAIFRKVTVLSITDKSGFYENLVDGEHIHQPVNVEYLLSLNELTLLMRVYSQFTAL